MRVFKDEVGLSNLIATLILIAIAIVGGAFAYTVFRDQAQTTTTSADLQVQDLTAQNINDNTYCSTTVKNVGSQLLDNIHVKIAPNGDNNMVDLDVGSLDPGQTGSASSMGNLTAGQEYPVRITADTPDSDSEPNVTKTMTVRVKS